MLSFHGIVKANIRQCMLIGALVLVTVMMSIPIPLLLQVLLDHVIPNKNYRLLLIISIIFATLVSLQLIFNYILSVISSKWTQNISYKLRGRIFNRTILRFETDDENRSVGKMAQTAIVSDCDAIAGQFQNLFISGVSSLVLTIIYLVILGWLSPYTFLALLIVLPIFILANLRMGDISKHSYAEVQSYKDRILSLISETIQAGIMINAYKVQDKYQAKFENDSSHLKQTAIKLNVIMTFVNSLSALITTMVPFAILIFGGYLVISGRSTLGSIVATYSYTAAVFGPIATLLVARHAIPAANIQNNPAEF
ncbi:ABC transporter transmembrane domain-containing protein, partial [Lacticaseibacillus manihotivorans]